MIALNRLRVAEDHGIFELIVGFNNNRFHAMKFNAGDTVEHVTQNLKHFVDIIESDKYTSAEHGTPICSGCARNGSGYCVECPDNPMAISSFIPMANNTSRKDRKQARKIAKLKDKNAWLKRIKG